MAAPLALDLSPPRPGAVVGTPIGGGWRHGFDLVLTASGNDRIVHDERGDRHVFARVEGSADTGLPTYTTRLPPVAGSGGALEVDGTGHRWTRPDGTTVSFTGSLPTAVDHLDGTASTLRYTAGRLVAVERSDGSILRLHHAEGRLRGATLPNGARIALTLGADNTLRRERRDGSGECLPPPAESGEPSAGTTPSEEGVPSSPDEDRCDSDANPPTAGFATAPGIPGAQRLDVRPASCRSHFVERRGTARGTAIERGLGRDAHYAAYEPTVRSFPIVDFIGAELRVVRSRDLALPSLGATPDGLFDRLIRDGTDIETHLLDPLARDGEIRVREGGATTVLNALPRRPVVLELVVRHGFASPDQMAQIERARAALLVRWNITLRVIEIP